MLRIVLISISRFFMKLTVTVYLKSVLRVIKYLKMNLLQLR